MGKSGWKIHCRTEMVGCGWGGGHIRSLGWLMPAGSGLVASVPSHADKINPTNRLRRSLVALAAVLRRECRKGPRGPVPTYLVLRPGLSPVPVCASILLDRRGLLRWRLLLRG